MTWALSLDDHKGQFCEPYTNPCGERITTYPLLNAMNCALKDKTSGASYIAPMTSLVFLHMFILTVFILKT